MIYIAPLSTSESWCITATQPMLDNTNDNTQEKTKPTDWAGYL